MSETEGDDDDDALAAAWGAETEGETPARVLNQAEIDSLLGFEGGGGGDDAHSGMQRIISSGLISYERLPMLEIVFDRLVRIMSTSLRNFTSDNVEVGIDNILSLRFGDYLNSIPLPAMLAVFKADEWDNYGLMVIDSAMIYSVVDVLLGGRRGTAAMRIEGRPYTTIERSLVERLIHVVLADLSASFDPLCPVNFRFERLEVNPRFAAISRLSNAAVLARLRIDMEDRGGRLELMLPYATLEPVRELLLQQFMGEKFGRDSIWETHLAEELWSTDIDLDVVLDEQVMRLSDVLNLTLGARIMLSARPGGMVRLRCGNVALFDGRVGHRKGKLAVRVEREVPRPSQDPSGSATTFRSAISGSVFSSMGNWQWLLDLPVTALLAATLLRTYRLDRALTALRRDRGVFEALMAEFDANARQARENIEKLRDTTDGAARGIERQSATALVLKDDLALLVERGERAAERLDHGLRLARARPMPSEPVRSEIAWSEPARSDPAPIASALAAARAAARMGGDGQGGDAARVRSKAERDLLMALQAGR